MPAAVASPTVAFRGPSTEQPANGHDEEEGKQSGNRIGPDECRCRKTMGEMPYAKIVTGAAISIACEHVTSIRARATEPRPKSTGRIRSAKSVAPNSRPRSAESDLQGGLVEFP